MGRKQVIKKTVFVSTPINLESIRKLRDAGYLTIIVQDDESVRVSRFQQAKQNLESAIERLKVARSYFQTCPMKDREVVLRLRAEEVERARATVLSLTA